MLLLYVNRRSVACPPKTENLSGDKGLAFGGPTLVALQGYPSRQIYLFQRLSEFQPSSWKSLSSFGIFTAVQPLLSRLL